MKKQDLDDRLIDLLQGRLSPEEEEEVIAGLEKSGITREEIESLRSFSRVIDDTPVPEPSEWMDKRFYALLEEEQRKAQPGEPDIKPVKPLLAFLNNPGFRIAAGIALFLLGWFAAGWTGSVIPVGNRQIANLAGEVKQLKETLILTMMRESSPAERIRAVNMVSDFETADEQIIEGLLGVLRNDSNSNLRLLALEALIRYSSLPEVRKSLVSSIGNQTSPLVQLRLAEIMLALGEKSAVPEFKKLLQDASLNYSVRDKLNEAVVVLL
ncbi:MAG: HEAT repeat domain-containing protein [Bacteroidales bacterium]|nr:HEAT repeat domain-containing protein [Bacteroidales bacterium]